MQLLAIYPNLLVDFKNILSFKRSGASLAIGLIQFCQKTYSIKIYKYNTVGKPFKNATFHGVIRFSILKDKKDMSVQNLSKSL